MLQLKKKIQATKAKTKKPINKFKDLGGEIGNPPFPNGKTNMPYVSTTMGGAKNGKKIKKAQIGISIGNKNGYAPKTSPLSNMSNKGKYEKKLDTIGNTIRVLDGKGNLLEKERIGTFAAKKLSTNYNKIKTDTENRRKSNSDFLESKSKIIKSSSMVSMKKGGKIKKN